MRGVVSRGSRRDSPHRSNNWHLNRDWAGSGSFDEIRHEPLKLIEIRLSTGSNVTGFLANLPDSE